MKLKEMEPYKHRVQYYETDRMGITHHSNYIRWMEEARTDFLSRIGWDYAKLESFGIVSPVVSVSCRYRKPTTFEDEVYISVKVAEFKGVKLILEYIMKNADGETVCEGNSVHAFLDERGRPIRMRDRFPKLSELLKELSAT